MYTTLIIVWIWIKITISSNFTVPYISADPLIVEYA